MSIDKQSFAPPRGMRDFLPAETVLRDWATSVILRAYERFGFTRIETSILENINRLRKSEGGENLALMFEVLKRGDKLDKELSEIPVTRETLTDLGLRFDLTVPLARFYSANQSVLPNPFKSVQIGYSWRAETPQPQLGRFRQFTQCDIDIIGVKSEIAEMELLQATAEALLNLGFKQFTFRINDRRILAALVKSCGFTSDTFDKVFTAIDKLDKIGLSGIESELLTITGGASATEKLINVFTAVKAAGNNLENIRQALPSDLNIDDTFQCLSKVVQAISQQSQRNYAIRFDPSLVRGMGYYTGQIFEIEYPGYPFSLGGGGRYDQMVGQFIGRDVPACGCSIGFERIMMILSERGFEPPQTDKVAFIFDAQDDYVAVLDVAQRIRSTGVTVSLLPRRKELRKQLDQLISQGYKSYVVFKQGDQQLEIKNLNLPNQLYSDSIPTPQSLNDG
jgi:histidyl-tRNA synthetase